MAQSHSPSKDSKEQALQIHVESVQVEEGQRDGSEAGCARDVWETTRKPGGGISGQEAEGSK